MIVAFATAFKQSRSNSAVVIFDGCDPEGEPSELSAGRYLYRLEIDKPKETRISIADADVHIESLDSPSDADRPLSDTESIAKTLLATEGDVRHAIDITDEALNILIWLSDSKTGVFRVTGTASIDLTIRFRPTDRRERALEVRFPFTNMISGKRGCDE